MEAQAVRDPGTGKLVVSPEEIQAAVVSHCESVLRNNKPDVGYENEIKLKEELHDLRMISPSQDSDNFQVDKKLFDKVVKKFQKGGKKNYDFLVKCGENFKNSVFKFCLRMISDETFPKLFD